MNPTYFALAAGFILVAGLAQAAEPAPASGSESLHTQKVSPNDYQSFVRNWDDKAHPHVFAAIQTPAQWNAVMAPAAVMGKHPPFAPRDEEFSKELFLMAASIMASPSSDFGKCYKVESAILKDGELTLAYQFIAPPKPASFTVKNYLGVWVPKRQVQKVIFVENGKRIGTLNLAGGQWCIPKL